MLRRRGNARNVSFSNFRSKPQERVSAASLMNILINLTNATLLLVRFAGSWWQLNACEFLLTTEGNKYIVKTLTKWFIRASKIRLGSSLFWFIIKKQPQYFWVLWHRNLYIYAYIVNNFCWFVPIFTTACCNILIPPPAGHFGLKFRCNKLLSFSWSPD